MNKKTIMIIGAIIGICVLIVIGWMIKEEHTIYPEDMLRPYASFDEAKKALKRRAEIYIPSHLPAQLAWPPSEVFAQRKPFPAIIMVFRQQGKTEPMLELIQYKSGTRFTDGSIKFTTIKQRGPFKMRGLDSLFSIGECGSPEPCATAVWDEGGFTFSAAMRGAPFELSKIAASMKR